MERPAAIAWTERATRDLDEIADFIAEDNPGAAFEWVESILSAVESAAGFPLAGRLVPEFPERQDLRERLIGTYRIVYRVRPGQVTVLTIFEGHRRLPDPAVGGAEDE
ncbi:MAG: type II toxin-antitoxin system RelE/ParE family toxin [Deltaproteobacteria bacterium]|nr:type II toxin-antitoxin system RelE/ParE family toxin [Deltaproteobacteria bacterium]